MSHNKLLQPKVRFREFTGENSVAWEQRKLKDLVQFSKGSGYSKADLREEGTPIILYGRLYTKYETIISNVDTFANPKPSSVFSRGGEVIVPASGETAEDISIASVVEKSGIILGGDLNVITPLQDLNSAFLAISISSGTPHMEMAKMAQGKSIVHLHNSDLEKIDLLYPKYNEQKKICSYFRNLDSLITLHQRKLNSIQDLKKTMLSKMFPKNIQKFPEIRFSGYQEAWEQRKLGDFGSVEMNRRIFKNETSESGDIPFYKIGTFGAIPDAYITRELFENYKDKYPYPEVGDILISASGSIGRTVVYTGEDEYFQDSNIVWLNHNGTLNNEFLNQFYQIVKWEGLEGSTIKRLYNKNILATSINAPKLEEQSKIGLFFKNIDNTITLHQREIENYKTLKQTLLTKMFV